MTAAEGAGRWARLRAALRWAHEDPFTPDELAVLREGLPEGRAVRRHRRRRRLRLLRGGVS